MALTKISRGLLSTGVSDSSDATAITIDSSENCSFTGTTTTTGYVIGNNTALYDDHSTLSAYSDSNGVYLNGKNAGWLSCSADGTQRTHIRLYGQTSSTGEVIAFSTAASERMRINSSGTLFIGKTGSAFATSGMELYGTGRAFITHANDDVLLLNRTGSAGKILKFYDDGSEVGSISTNTHSLPSDKNFKKNINNLDLGLNLIKKLKPSQYNYKHNDDNTPLMYGLIAQELEESLTEVGVEKNSTWLLQHNPTEDEKQSDYDLDYGKLTPILIKAIQEQQTQIEALQSEINTLKGGE